ncbi:MAG: TolC family protein [Chitinophagales bacterium]|nr:TolC family protein [Chitinophagales bacterium]MDW8427289.1 TolC family protein [Chitinophagales bacterium]
MKFTRSLWVLLLVLPFGSAGQENAVPRFSLADAIAYALEHQLSQQNARLQAEKARRNVQEVIGIGLPQITAQGDFTHYLELPTSLVPAEFFGGEAGTFVPIQFGTSFNTSAGLTLTQLIFDGRYLLGVKAAQVVQELAAKEVRRNRTELIYQVAKSYLTVLITDLRLEQLHATLNNMRALLQQTELMHQAGFVEQLDVNRLQVSVNNLVTEVEKVSALRQLSLDLLKFQMGMPVNSSIQLSDTLREMDLSDMWNYGAADPERRIEYAMLRDQVTLAEMNVKRYRAGYYPSVYGAASLLVQSQENRIRDIPEGTWYDVSLVGLTLSVPIFDGFSKARQVQAAKTEFLQAQNNLELFRQNVEVEVRAARTNLENALRTLQLNRTSLELAKEVMRNAQIKYEQQVGSSLELKEAETTLKNAQAAYAASLYEAWLARLELEKALGILDQRF